MARIVVIGYGHGDRGDDAAGLLVARALEAQRPPGLEVCSITGDALSLIECWEFAHVAIVVDAVDSGRTPGVVYRYEDREAIDAAAESLTSTHALGLREAVQLGCLLGRMPKRFVFYGIEAHNFGIGEPVSPEVAEAVRVVAARILLEWAALIKDADE